MTDASVSPIANSENREVQVGLLRNSARAIKSGRSTSAFVGDERYNANNLLRSAWQSHANLAYMLPWEILDITEMLSTFNPDYSQAVENLKMLANSGHKLQIDSDSDLQRRKAKDYLEGKSRLIQEQHGGIDGVIEKLMDQAATYGAMAGEWVLDDALSEVVDFVDINPKKIRFFWMENEQIWAPFQKVSTLQAKEAEKNGQQVLNNCVRLDPITFRYYAFDAAPGSPYGTPPFVAALANIAIQQDLVHNLAQIVKKIGLLGIVDLSIERLQQLPGETDTEYASRAGKYLDDYVVAAEEMVKDGGLVHFDDVVANSWSIGGNAAGATNIHKQNEELIFSGLKSMPSVQGRSYSTTETYAGVAYDIIIRNTLKYQRAAKRMMESGYWLMATLGGFRVNDIALVFNKNRTLQRLQEVQAQSTEIRNAFNKWAMGIIDQMGVAQELGYDQPKTQLQAPPDTTLLQLGVERDEAIYPPRGDFDSNGEIRGTMEEVDERDEAEGSEFVGD